MEDMSMSWEEDTIFKRHELTIERIRDTQSETSVEEPYRDFFRRTSAFLIAVEDARTLLACGFSELSVDKRRDMNHFFYQELLPSAYEESYLNPAYAVRMLGTE